MMKKATGGAGIGSGTGGKAENIPISGGSIKAEGGSAGANGDNANLALWTGLLALSGALYAAAKRRTA